MIMIDINGKCVEMDAQRECEIAVVIEACMRLDNVRDADVLRFFMRTLGGMLSNVCGAHLERMWIQNYIEHRCTHDPDDWLEQMTRTLELREVYHEGIRG